MTSIRRSVVLPDGRDVRASYDGDDDRWTVQVSGADEVSVTQRDLTAALYELLDLQVHDDPRWLRDVLRTLSGYDTPRGRRFPCPCCGYLTLSEPASGTYQLCPVCNWEDDGVQFRDPAYTGGANDVSLEQARENFRVLGVSDPRSRDSVRAPLPEEARLAAGA